MKKYLLLFASFLLFSSHDMFLKLDSFYLKPNHPASIRLYNGTFEKSENTIDRNRMQDVALLGNGSRQHPADSLWTEKDNLTVLNFQTGEPGTWVAGLSTHPKNIELSATDFNDYLQHDGVLDMLEWRKQNNALDQPAVEKYSKHVKAIFQVGNKKTADWKTPLGYPIEFVPQRNPYELAIGDKLPVQLLRNGLPLADQLVYAGFDGAEHMHAHPHEEEPANEGHQHQESKWTTDTNGLINLEIDHEGHWYLRTIHMTLSSEPGLTHESNWATLTFEVRKNNLLNRPIPIALYGVGSLLLLTALFLYLRKK